jgi:adenine-specific DNA-methyltransferase
MKEWLKKEANPVEKEDLERHDKWLCMMWPRLQLLKELLSDDGCIFVCIDDVEVGNLRVVMEEIFGELQFLANFVWQSKDTPGNNSTGIAQTHNHILLFRKSDYFAAALLDRNEEQIANYTNPDNDRRGPWLATPLTRAEHRDRDYYAITNNAGRKVYPPKGSSWRRPPEKMKALATDRRIWWGKDGDADFPMEKKFLSEAKSGVVNQTWWPYEFAGSTRNASAELKALFDGDKTFETPKPLTLIQRFLELATDKDAVILDSFAGSATTAHAVLEANRLDGGSRRFILVEMEDYAGNLTAERVRRAIRGYQFSGTASRELYRERLTWARLQKASAIVEKVESIEKFEGAGFDKVTKIIEDGELIVTGETKSEDKVDGLGGSFTFCTLGAELSIEALLAGGLPSFDALAKYVFHTATGRTLDAVPKQTAKQYGLIGETDLYRVHLLYQPDAKWLASNEAALTEALVDAMKAINADGKRLLVFAAAKFISQRDLNRLQVEFCQLPYAIHRLLGD